MAAFNPLLSNDSGDDRVSREPSMEEILASIRRIISDDQSFAVHRDQLRSEIQSARPQEETDIAPSQEQKDKSAQLERSGERAVDHAKAGWGDDEKMVSHVPFVKPAPGVDAALTAVPGSGSPAPLAADNNHQPADFADMRLRQHPAETEAARHVSQAGSSAILSSPRERPLTEPSLRTEEPLISAATDAAVASSFNALFASRLMPDAEMLAEVTRELLRPMLKAWLDDNLPVMVERLVRAEIERVARGGR